MPLPRPLVQFALNFLQKLLCDICEVGTLGDILTNKSVGVLVGSSLPGMVWSCKEEAHACGPGNAFVLGELQTVVSSDGLHAVLPVNDFRSFGDVDSVRDCTPSLSQGSALLVPSATMTQMLVQFAPVGLVPPYILKYGLVRYHLDALFAAYAHYLLWAVVHKNHFIHLLPDIFLESAWQTAATPSVGGPLLSYPWLVTSVSAIAVSLNLPRDG